MPDETLVTIDVAGGMVTLELAEGGSVELTPDEARDVADNLEDAADEADDGAEDEDGDGDGED